MARSRAATLSLLARIPEEAILRSRTLGDWSVKDDNFCTFYEGQEGACFTVERDGSNCFTFFEMIPDKDGKPVPDTNWTSRGWSRDHAPTCPKPPERPDEAHPGLREPPQSPGE